MNKSLEHMKNMHVITLDTGKMLGVVEEFYFDPDRMAIAGMQLRANGFFSRGPWIHTSAVERIGEDVIFLSDNEQMTGTGPDGRSLKEFIGMPVTTKAGRNMGILHSVEIDDEWYITGIRLKDNKLIEVDQRQTVFGLDAILIQADAQIEATEQEKEKKGLFQRFLGNKKRSQNIDSFDDTIAAEHPADDGDTNK